MGGIFRLTSAEFKKIFKRPSVFFVAILLVGTIFISLQFFNPTPRTNYNVIYDNLTNSTEYYDYFNSDSSINSKTDIDLIYSNCDDIVSYYTGYYDRSQLLNKYYDDIFIKYNKLKNELDNNAKNNYYEEFKTALTTFKSKYLDFSGIENYNHIQNIVSSTAYATTACADLDKLIDATNTYTSTSIINYFETEDFTTKLQAVLNTGMNAITSTIKFMGEDIKNNYNDYSLAITKGSLYIAQIKKERIELKTSLEQYESYLKVITESEFPIAIVNATKLDDIKLILENSIDMISEVNSANDSLIDKHKSILSNLSQIGIPNATNNFINELIEVKINKDISTLLTSTKDKVLLNKVVISTEIDNLKNDEGIKTISEKITNYKLLADTYKEYINDNIVYSITHNYSPSQYNNFNGYNFDKFNAYQYKERITLNKYYIDNNVYENLYLDNFNITQSSDTTANLYDFMYFSMELCIIIITIFAMMQMCSLITNETESGTIKLLLVRPYKRSKIITAKLFATILLSITFVIFCGAITFAGGYFMFGNTTKTVLTVINATTVKEFSPLLLMFINLGSLILDVIFYIFVALCLSLVIKNYAGAISFTLIFYLINMALTFIFGSSLWYVALPAINLHLFRYFGNSFIATENSILTKILSPSIIGTINIWVSISIYLAYSITLLIISYSIFNKRDY